MLSLALIPARIGSLSHPLWVLKEAKRLELMTCLLQELDMLYHLKSFKKSMEALTSTARFGKTKSALTTSMITHAFKTFL